MALSPTSQVKILASVFEDVKIVAGEKVLVAAAIEVKGLTLWYDKDGTHLDNFWNYNGLPTFGRIEELTVGRTDRTELEIELQVERSKTRFNSDNYKLGKNDHLSFVSFLVNYLTHSRLPAWLTTGRNMYIELIEKYADTTVNMLLNTSINNATITPEQELMMRLSHVMNTTLLMSSSLDTVTKFSEEIDSILSKYIKDEERVYIKILIQKLYDLEQLEETRTKSKEMDSSEQEQCCKGIETILDSFDRMGRVKKRFVIFDMLRATLRLSCKFPEELYNGSFVNKISKLYKERIFKSQACPISLCLFLTNYITRMGYKNIDIYNMSLMLANMLRQKEGVLFHYVLNVCINIGIVFPSQMLIEKHGEKSASEILVDAIISVLVGNDIVYSFADAEQAFRFIGRIIAATFGNNESIIEHAKQLIEPNYYIRFKDTIMPTLGELYWMLKRL